MIVELKTEGLVCDLIYAKHDNFVGKQIYINSDVCLMHADTAKMISIAVKLAQKLGYIIKVVDAFRPIEVQKILWGAYPDEKFVSNPFNTDVSLGHCRGGSVDVTLIEQKTGTELPMGTPIDYFGHQSFPSSTDIGLPELNNRMLLIGIMSAAGFITIPTEWWHFNIPNLTSYPIIEGGLNYVPILP